MTTAANVPDQQLVQGYLRGDGSCFDQLHERYRRPLYSYLNGMLPRQPETVDDLYQKTWIKAINALERYREQQTFLAWLFRIGRNTAIDHFRRQRKEAHEDIDDVPITDDQPDAWRDMERTELLEAVRKAVEQLPQEQREVVLLRQNNLSFKEIAALHGCSINTVLGRMHYAVQRLRKQLNEWR